MRIMKGSILAITLLTSAGCRTREPAPPETPAPAVPGLEPAPSSGRLEVLGIDLGRSVGADKKVAMPMTAFGTRDTIYASVATGAAGAAGTLAARWSFTGGGRTVLVDSTSQAVTTSGPAVTEFHISKPDGWPPGAYRVEILADGKVAGTREFEVR